MTTDKLLPTPDEIKEILSLVSIHCTAKGEDYDVAVSMQIAKKIRDKILERRLDRPKLKEDIAEQAYTSYTIANSGTIGLDWCPNWADLPEQHKQEWRSVAEGLLALKPTDEEVRKQERVRIRKQLATVENPQLPHKETFYPVGDKWYIALGMLEENWETLKEE